MCQKCQLKIVLLKRCEKGRSFDHILRSWIKGCYERPWNSLLDPLSLTEIKLTNIKLTAWISNHTKIKQYEVVTHPCPDLNGDLAKPPLKLRHGLVITSHIKQRVWFLIHAQLISVDSVTHDFEVKTVCYALKQMAFFRVQMRTPNHATC